MPKLRSLTALLASCVGLVGCASVRYNRIDDTLDLTDEGIRYYRSAPYLLVHTDSKGGLLTQIVYLPDQTQLFAAKPTAKWAALKTTLKFDNGVLTESSDTADSTAIPTAVIGSLQAIAARLVAANEAETAGAPAPYLYRMVVHDGTIHFYGSQGDTGIRVAVKPKEK